MISIAMTTYNGEKFIHEQIDSILNQSYQDFELIICDDSSSDKTYLILQEYGYRDSRIRIYQNNNRLGYIKNFEKVIGLCQGELIALSDQDDIWEYNHIELLSENIDHNLLICSNALLVNEKNESLDFTMKDVIHIRDIPQDPYLLFKRLLHINFVQGTSMLFKKELFYEAIPFPEDIPHDYWLAILAAAKSRLVYYDSITLHYRQHGNNVTVNKRIPAFKKIISKNTHYQLNLLYYLQNKLSLSNEYCDLLHEALFVYSKDNSLLNEIKKIFSMYTIYKEINWSNSSLLLFYRLFRFVVFKLGKK